MPPAAVAVAAAGAADVVAPPPPNQPNHELVLAALAGPAALAGVSGALSKFAGRCHHEAS